MGSSPSRLQTMIGYVDELPGYGEIFVEGSVPRALRRLRKRNHDRELSLDAVARAIGTDVGDPDLWEALGCGECVYAATRTELARWRTRGAPLMRSEISQWGALALQIAAIAGNEPGSSFIELRLLDPPQERTWIGVQDRDRAKQVAAAIVHLRRQNEVYIGAAPRVRRSGKLEDIERVWTLWADCDRERVRQAPGSVQTAASDRDPVGQPWASARLLAAARAGAGLRGQAREQAPGAGPEVGPKRSGRREGPAAGRRDQPQDRRAVTLCTGRAGRVHGRRGRRSLAG